jgi:hypothetical protein
MRFLLLTCARAGVVRSRAQASANEALPEDSVRLVRLALRRLRTAVKCVQRVRACPREYAFRTSCMR